MGYTATGEGVSQYRKRGYCEAQEGQIKAGQTGGTTTNVSALSAHLENAASIGIERHSQVPVSGVMPCYLSNGKSHWLTKSRFQSTYPVQKLRSVVKL